MKTITNKEIGYNGRLGNQLFQFCSLYGIAREVGKTPVLPIENIQANERGKLELYDIFPGTHQFFGTPPVDDREVGETIFSQRDENTIDLCKKDANINLAGYFQSPLYFNKYKEELLEILTFKDTKPLDISTSKPIVSIHVRRTDYLNNTGAYTQLADEYYCEAVSYFPKCSFLVFSDDIGWCKKNFPESFFFSEGKSQEEDLRIMSLCDHHILSNSTFCWWAAYLNQNGNKKIISPKTWYLGPYSHCSSSELNSIATTLI